MDISTYILIGAAALALNLFIIFIIIRLAVKSATKDLLRSTRLQTYLTVQDLKHKGIPDDRIKEAVRLVDEIDALRQSKVDHYLTEEQYKQKLKDYIV